MYETVQRNKGGNVGTTRHGMLLPSMENPRACQNALSLIIFNRVGTAGDKPCHNALHQPNSSRSETRISRYSISTLRYSELSAVVNSESLVAGVTVRVCPKCSVVPAAVDTGVAECQ